MDTNTNKEKVEVLLKKASESDKSEDAMRFSQSALNSSHAMEVLQTVERNTAK